MAKTKSPGEVLQSWLSPSFARKGPGARRRGRSLGFRTDQGRAEREAPGRDRQLRHLHSGERPMTPPRLGFSIFPSRGGAPAPRGAERCRRARSTSSSRPRARRMAEIRFPTSDPADELACDLDDVVNRALATDQLAEHEAPVAREIGERLIVAGCDTFADAVERLEVLGPDGRRKLLDEARVSLGMETIAEIEQRREDARFESAWQRLQPPPPPEWSPLQSCPACGTRPVKDGGAWAEVECEQWWCFKHRAGHEADMEPHQPAYVLNANAAPVPSERERARLEACHRERQGSEERERELREEHADRQNAASDQVWRVRVLDRLPDRGLPSRRQRQAHPDRGRPLRDLLDRNARGL